MSMRSITTWTFKPHEPLELASCFADQEGTAFLHSADSSYLCLSPEEKIEGGCWEELERRLSPFDGALPIPKWVGYLGYEMRGFAGHQSLLPDALFYRPATVIHFDHRTHQAALYGKEIPFGETRVPRASHLTLGYRSDTLESYLDKIALIKEWILEGEVYQVNLSQEFHLEGKGDPFELFQKIAALNPAPFSAYIHCGDFTLVSSSPERFLCRKGDILESRPIKGTAPRGKTVAEDEKNRQSLLESEKERAELLMITDLMRNDLGKVADFGSVRVREMWRCEAYANVFHLLSIIEGRCRGNPVAVVKQLFPGGSVTGCPKLRAMEAIAVLEKRPRGVYTGSIGYFAENGDFDFNMAIRTLIVHARYVQIQLGGAIVIDSDPLKEYEETLHKGNSLFNVLGAHELCVL